MAQVMAWPLQPWKSEGGALHLSLPVLSSAFYCLCLGFAQAYASLDGNKSEGFHVMYRRIGVNGRRAEVMGLSRDVLFPACCIICA